MGSKIPEFEKYIDWLNEKRRCDISSNYETYYNAIVNTAKTYFEDTDIWKSFVENLKVYHDEYLLKTGYFLLYEFQPKIDIKSYNSFLLKTYRKNVLENDNWPKKPIEGWILPKNWYSEINDIIRTCIIVKYLDGMEFLIGKIKSYCEKKNMYCRVDLEAKEEGYYAAHLYTKVNIEIPKEDWDTRIETFQFEIQITSQLQEVIRTLLHKYYEQRRKKLKTENEIVWQWDYKSDEFATNYLGHILHYLEGMIMDIREKQKEDEENERRI